MLFGNKRDRFILFLSSVLFLASACQDREAKIAETIDLSQRYLHEGDSHRAVELLKDLSDDYPDELAVLEALAFARATAGDYLLAAHRFEQIARTDPKQSHYLLYAAKSLQAGSELEQARELYREYLQIDPTDAMVWNALGELHESLDQPDEAIKAYMEKDRLKPSGSNAFRLGKLFSHQANTAEAESWYQVAIELDDGSKPEPYIGLLGLAMEQANYPLMEKIITEIDNLFPGELDVSPLSSSRAQLAKWRQKQEEQERKFREEERITRELKEKEETERRAQLLAKNEKEPPEEPPPPPPITAESLLQEARQLKLEGSYADAVANYWESLKLDDSRPEVWFELSETLLADDQLAWAEATALEAIRRNPQSTLFTMQYLAVAQLTKNPEQFLKELVRAKERLKESPEITLALARGYRNISQSKRNAAILYREVLEMLPNHPDRDAIQAELDEVLQSR